MMSGVTTPVYGNIPVQPFQLSKLKDRLQFEDLETERNAVREIKFSAPVHSPTDSEGLQWPSPRWEMLASHQLKLLLRPGHRDRCRDLILDPISSKFEAEHWINRLQIARFGKRLDDADLKLFGKDFVQTICFPHLTYRLSSGTKYIANPGCLLRKETMKAPMSFTVT